MPQPTAEVTHTLQVAADPRTVFDLIAEVTEAPRHFSAHLHAEYLERGETQDVFQRWSVERDQETIRTWTARRRLDREALTITFEHETPKPPVSSMRGEWKLTPQADGTTSVEISHHFSVVGDDPETLKWASAGLDRNVQGQLEQTKAIAERWAELQELTLEHEESLLVHGSLDDVYGFLYEAGAWPERLPHIAATEVKEEAPGLQIVDMTVEGRDGIAQRTRSARVCVPGKLIVHKQVLGLPPLLDVMLGSCDFAETADGVLVTARQTIVIKESAIEEKLGAGATVADARVHLTKVLQDGVLSSVRHAKAYAEERASATV
ncbi:SRPBCC family protein (plasmid) [Streptomyces sp. NBC_00435]|uniref:aromatase/cyclase n=1 Tax=Streptomyces sp. NBC_00435 TaxID=2903649 RepID=UPI002E1B4750